MVTSSEHSAFHAWTQEDGVMLPYHRSRRCQQTLSWWAIEDFARLRQLRVWKLLTSQVLGKRTVRCVIIIIWDSELNAISLIFSCFTNGMRGTQVVRTTEKLLNKFLNDNNSKQLFFRLPTVVLLLTNKSRREQSEVHPQCVWSRNSNSLHACSLYANYLTRSSGFLLADSLQWYQQNLSARLSHEAAADGAVFGRRIVAQFH